MPNSRRRFLGCALATGALLATGPAFAQTLGSDYTLIQPPQPTESAGKIEVLEFFSYGCPHCYEFHPLISAWAAKQPADVVFRRVPVTFGRAAWANISRLYFALEATGDLTRLDNEVFKAIHGERTNLFDEKTITDWVGKRGVDTRRFGETFSSFGVMSKVKRGDQLAQAYRITGVPAIAVDGKFLVGGKDFNDALAISDKLIARLRAEKAGRK